MKNIFFKNSVRVSYFTKLKYLQRVLLYEFNPFLKTKKSLKTVLGIFIFYNLFFD